MIRLRILALLAAFAASGLGPATAQSPARLPGVGLIVLSSVSDEELGGLAHPLQRAFVEALRERGWVDGRNVRLAFRSAPASASRGVSAVDSLMSLPVDVLVAPGETAAEAAKRSPTTPIVGIGFDTALVPSLGRPGGNLTGVVRDSDERDAIAVRGKLLALLKEASGAKRVGRVQLVQDGDDPNPRLSPDSIALAKSIGVTLELVAAKPAQLETTVSRALRRGVDGLVVTNHTLWTPELSRRLGAIARRERIPVAAEPIFNGSFDEVAILTYGVDLRELFSRSAYYVDRILKGTRAAELPVERVDVMRLDVNMRNAEAIGIRIPPPVLLEAKRVIR